MTYWNGAADYPQYDLYLVTPHDEDDLVVPLEEAKKHLRVDFEDDDDLIESLVLAVTAYLDGKDGFLGRALLDQTWDLKLSAFPCGPIKIPLPPLIEVVSVSYIDPDAVTQTFNLDDCYVTGIGNRGQIHLVDGVSWPSVGVHPEPVTVRFRAGYLDTSDSPPINNVPKTLIAGIKLTLGSLYENRENSVVGTIASQLPDGADKLFHLYKVFKW